MSEAVALDLGPGTAPEFRLAECWADFTKALAIYPETNARVRGALSDMLDALEAALTRARQADGADAERGIAVLFHEDCVLVDGGQVPFSPGTPCEWLRVRLERAGLAGVEFLPDAGRDGLVAFSRRLLQNFLRKGRAPDFEDLWPERYAGLALIDRRFEGTFGGTDASGAFMGGHDGPGPGGDGDRFVKALLTHPRIAKRLSKLQAAGHETAIEGEATACASGTLRSILNDLPAEALCSRDVLIQSLCRVMDALVRRAQVQAADEDADAKRDRLAELLQRVSRQHFAREGPDIERLATDRVAVEGPGGGRARDALFDNDVAALLREVQALPSRTGIVLREDGPDEITEQLCALLHFLTHLERPEAVRGLLPLLTRRLERAGPAATEVLRRHVDPEEGAEPRQREAVVQLLLRTGQGDLLRACGALQRDEIVEMFPTAFGLYLQTLDLDREADVAELDEVCARLGPHRLLAEAREYAPLLARLTGADAARFFVRPTRARLPLIRTLLAYHQEPHLEEAATFLRALDLPEHESFVLYHVADAHILTTEYLCGLVDLHLGRLSRSHMQERVSEVLCRHIESLGARSPRSVQRLESLRHLGRFPSARARRLLQELRCTRFLGLFGAKEPTTVRRLARDIARTLQVSRGTFHV